MKLLYFNTAVCQQKFDKPCSRCKVIKMMNFKYSTTLSQSKGNRFCSLHVTQCINIYYYTCYHWTARLFHISSPQLQHNESNTNLFTHTTAAWNFLVCNLQLYFHGACLASNTATAAILFYCYLQSGKITSSPSTY